MPCKMEGDVFLDATNLSNFLQVGVYLLVEITGKTVPVTAALGLCLYFFNILMALGSSGVVTGVSVFCLQVRIHTSPSEASTMLSCVRLITST